MYHLHQHPEKGTLKAADTPLELQRFATKLGLERYFILFNGSVIYSQSSSLEPVFLRQQSE